MTYHEEIWERDDGECQWCGVRSNLHVHHIVYRSAGGDDESDNLILLCAKDHANLAHGFESDKYRRLFKEILYERNRSREDLFEDLLSSD